MTNYALSRRTSDTTSSRTVAMAATFDLTPLELPVTYLCRKLNVADHVVLANYGQAVEEVLNPTSTLATNKSGANVVLLRTADICRTSPRETVQQLAAFLAQRLESIAATHSAPWIFGVAPSLCLSTRDARQFDRRLSDMLTEILGIYKLPLHNLAHRYRINQVFDPFLDDVANVPFTEEYFAGIAAAITRQLSALTCAPYKVLALDCDDTLWGGNCSDTIDRELDVSGGHEFLQRFATEQLRAGRLLCLVSHNVEQDVWRALERRHMPLCKDDFVTWRIGWESKTDALRSLAEELNLGLDSFVFVDNDRLQCELVREELPSVTVVELSSHPDTWPDILEHVWKFDVTDITDDDRHRPERYRAELVRRRQAARASDLDAFLSDLRLEIDWVPLDDTHLDRAAQLTLRTNQFTMTARRYTPHQLRVLLQDPNCSGWAVAARDRLGDYGFVGLAIGMLRGTSFVVDTFLLSCRVLGRRIETRMIDQLRSAAAADGASYVRLDLVPTSRNEPARRFLADLGPIVVDPDGVLHCDLAVTPDGTRLTLPHAVADQ
jgi:FkbH-like protein